MMTDHRNEMKDTNLILWLLETNMHELFQKACVWIVQNLDSYLSIIRLKNKDNRGMQVHYSVMGIVTLWLIFLTHIAFISTKYQPNVNSDNKRFKLLTLNTFRIYLYCSYTYQNSRHVLLKFHVQLFIQYKGWLGSHYSKTLLES